MWQNSLYARIRVYIIYNVRARVGETIIRNITPCFLLQCLCTEFEFTSPDGTGVTYKSHDVNQPEGLHLNFSTKGHTGTVVPVFAYGAGAKKFSGIFQNKELPGIIEGLIK